MLPGWGDLGWDGACPVPEASFVSWRSPLLDVCFSFSVQTRAFFWWDASHPPCWPLSVNQTHFHIWFNGPTPPRWHIFQPWPDSDNAIWSFGCTESRLLLWLDLYWIDINVHWFVTLIPLNSVIAGEDRQWFPMSQHTHNLRCQSFDIVANSHPKFNPRRETLEASIKSRSSDANARKFSWFLI